MLQRENLVNLWKKESMSTGLPSLDYLTGGLPKGECVHIQGPPSIGKTALALHCCRNKIALWVSGEFSPTLQQLKANHIDLQKFMHLPASPDWEAITLKLLGLIDIIIIDSANSFEMTPQEWRRLTLKWNTLFPKLSIIILHQQRILGNPRHIFKGGVVWILKPRGILRNHGIPNGQILQVNAPQGSIELELKWGEGIDRYASLLDKRLLTREIIINGSWYFYKERNIGQGRSEAVYYLRRKYEKHT